MKLEGVIGAKAGSTKAGTTYWLYPDLVYLPGGTRQQNLDIYIPDAAAPGGGWPTVIYAHGGAFIMGDKADAGSSLDYALMALDNGFAMISVNYRLAGMDHIELEISDVWAALQWVGENASLCGLDPAKLAFLGASAGASLTSAVAAKAGLGSSTRVIATISISGAFHATRTADYLDAHTPPFYIAHGTKDSAVRFSVAEDFCAALSKAGVSYHFEAVEGADHCRPNDDPSIYKVLDGVGKLNDAYDWLRRITEG